MSAYIGYCFDKGAFLSADSRRTSLVNGEAESDQVEKIRKLTESILVATGGLGTVGHECMDKLQKVVSPNDQIDSIISKATPIFAEKYKAFAEEHPEYQTTPLCAIFAGYDPLSESGFIRVLTEKDMFVTPFLVSPGHPYFSGSNTKLVIEEASKIFFEMVNMGKKYRLDLWTIKSMQVICRKDSHVAPPVHLWIVREKVIQEKTWQNDEEIQTTVSFEVDFPKI